MPSKKPVNKPLVYFGATPVRGRRPKVPEQLDLRLEHLLKASEAWLRLIREEWFSTGKPVIELGIGATALPRLDDLYDDAIKQFQTIGATVDACIEKLEVGKRNAAKKYKSVSSSGRSTLGSARKRPGKR